MSDTNLKGVVLGLILCAGVFSICSFANEPPGIVWQKAWNGGNNDYGSGIAVDSSGNVYVTGNSFNGANNDCLTIKYNSSGDTVWQKAWNSGNDDYGSGIAVDSSGNVYVTGGSYNGTNYDYYTIKYNSSGTPVWQKRWNSGSDDNGYGITVDDTGNVYVTGSSNNGIDYDYFTIKYNGTDGETIWQKASDSGNWDDAYCIAVDDTGNVYVTGESYNGIDYDYFTIKYNGTDGETIWQKASDSGNEDYGYGIAVDDTGNVYVTGGSYNGTNYDYLTIKYNSSRTLVWQEAWGGGNDDYGYGIAIDSSGNVYVTGESSNGANSDYLTIKYDDICPGLTYFNVISRSVCFVNFSETMDLATTLDTNAYTQSGASGPGASPNPDQVLFDTSVMPAFVLIYNNAPFAETDNIQISISDTATDLSGNSVDPLFNVLSDNPAGGETWPVADDFTGPLLVGAKTISETTVEMYFDENLMNPEQYGGWNTQQFSIEGNTVTVAALKQGDSKTIVITVANLMGTGDRPDVTLNWPANDTFGNPSDTGTVIPADGIPPKVVAIDVKSRAYAAVAFSETVSASALNPASYSQAGGTGESATANPVFVMFDPYVELMLGSPGYDLIFNYPAFYETNSVVITVSNVSDLSGNTLALTVISDDPAGGETMDDFVPPTLFRAKVINNTQVQVIFSENVANDTNYNILIDTNAIQVDTYTNKSITTPYSYAETVIITVNGTIDTGTIHIIRIAGVVFDMWLNQARIGETVATTAAPKLIFFNALAQGVLILNFDNLMDMATALNTNSYTQTGAPGNASPEMVIYDTSIIPMFVLLYNDSPFRANQNITMTVASSVMDVNGNLINPSFRILSDNPAGGETTPVADDFTSPHFMGARTRVETTVEMLFDETLMDPAQYSGGWNTQQFSVAGNTVTAAVLKQGDSKTIVVTVANPMGTGDRPDVTLNWPASDTFGNLSDTGTVTASDSIPPKVMIALTVSKRVFGVLFSETMSATALIQLLIPRQAQQATQRPRTLFWCRPLQQTGELLQSSSIRMPLLTGQTLSAWR